MHYLLFYDYVEDYETRRTPLRKEHLRRAVEAHARGELVLAGALSEPEGAVLVFKGDSPEVAEAFARADPYVAAGLVSRWQVRPWNVVIGDGAAAAVEV